jgi:hypothetical protein
VNFDIAEEKAVYKVPHIGDFTDQGVPKLGKMESCEVDSADEGSPFEFPEGKYSSGASKNNLVFNDLPISEDEEDEEDTGVSKDPDLDEVFGKLKELELVSDPTPRFGDNMKAQI